MLRLTLWLFPFTVLCLPAQTHAQGLLFECGTDVACWYIHKPEFEALMAKGFSAQYDQLLGPPWDPCRFAKAAGFTCHELTLTFKGTRILRQKGGNNFDYECTYVAKGLGVLFYKDMDQEYGLTAVGPTHYTNFTSCKGSGKRGTIQCGRDAATNFYMNISYEKGENEYPFITISSPESKPCAGSWQDPTAFVASFEPLEHVDLMPAFIRRHLDSGNMELSLKDSKVVPGETDISEGRMNIRFGIQFDPK